MKKKILTVSILLAITAIALVGYFIGCRQQRGGTSPADGIEPAQLQKDVAEDEIRLRTQLSELIKAEDKKRADILAKPDTDRSGIPRVTSQDGDALDSFKVKSGREMGELLLESDSQEAQPHAVTGRVPVLGVDENVQYGGFSAKTHGPDC